MPGRFLTLHDNEIGMNVRSIFIWWYNKLLLTAFSTYFNEEYLVQKTAVTYEGGGSFLMTNTS